VPASCDRRARTSKRSRELRSRSRRRSPRRRRLWCRRVNSSATRQPPVNGSRASSPVHQARAMYDAIAPTTLRNSTRAGAARHRFARGPAAARTGVRRAAAHGVHRNHRDAGNGARRRVRRRRGRCWSDPQAALAAVGGRGGGSPRLAQGTVPSADALEGVVAALTSALGAAAPVA
jgi:hypothetical protein